MTEKGPKEIEEFAFEFGNHCAKFSNHIHFKQFIQDLIKDLTDQLDERQMLVLQEYIERLSKSRSKEVEEGLLKKYQPSHQNESDESENESENNDTDDDFM